MTVKKNRIADNEAPAGPIKQRHSANKAWQEVIRLVESPVYPIGFELFRQDSPAQSVYFSESGLVKLMRSEENGREFILCLKFSGSILGAAAAIHGTPHPFSAVTITRCKLARLAAPVFLNLIVSNSQLALFLNEELSAEILDQTTRFSQIACLPARHRLEQLLWQLSREGALKGDKSELKFQLPLRNWEAAQLLAITPTYLSRLLSELEQERVISRIKGWIIIPEPEKLWHGPESSGAHGLL